MRRTIPRAALLLAVAAVAAWALPIDRGIVEDGTDSNVSDGGTDGGVMLVNGQGATRLRPATCAASSCTRVVPDAGTEGVDLGDIVSCRLMACAPGVQLLTGAGREEAYAWDRVYRQWGAMPEKDKSITVSGYGCQAFPVEVNGMAADGVRLLYRPNGIGVSGNDGGSVVTSLQCCKRGSVPLGSSGYPGCGT